MIVNERMTSFINSFEQGNSSCLEELEMEARKTNVPIIRTEMQSLMRFLLKLYFLLRIYRKIFFVIQGNKASDNYIKAG